MGILAHYIATSASGKMLSFDKLISLVNDLLDEHIASLPAAILVRITRKVCRFLPKSIDLFEIAGCSI